MCFRHVFGHGECLRQSRQILRIIEDIRADVQQRLLQEHRGMLIERSGDDIDRAAVDVSAIPVPHLDGTLDETLDATFDGTLDGTFDGTFDGTLRCSMSVGSFDGGIGSPHHQPVHAAVCHRVLGTEARPLRVVAPFTPASLSL